MPTTNDPLFSLEPPKVSLDKVRAIMGERKMKQAHMAKALGISEGALSRQLGQQLWRDRKITELAAALEVQPTDLIGEIKATNGRFILERVCGKAGKQGFLMPKDTYTRMLRVNGEFGAYLVAPDSIEPEDEDRVVMETTTKRGTVVGQVVKDGPRWIVTQGGGKPFTIERRHVKSIAIVIAHLGGAWGTP